MKRTELIHKIAHEINLYNYGTIKKISDLFIVDNRQYSVAKELKKWLKENGYVSLLKLMELK